MNYKGINVDIHISGCELKECKSVFKVNNCEYGITLYLVDVDLRRLEHLTREMIDFVLDRNVV